MKFRIVLTDENFKQYVAEIDSGATDYEMQDKEKIKHYKDCLIGDLLNYTWIELQDGTFLNMSKVLNFKIQD